MINKELVKKFNINLNKIPSAVGVYFWKDKNDQILYIGKSKNIKKRLIQYLSGSINSFKTKLLIEKSIKFEYIICDNETNALLLEQNLIKQNQPFYNILLLDDKKYPFIYVEEKKHTLDIKVKFNYEQKRDNQKSFFFGPLPKNDSLSIIVKLLNNECLYENGLPIHNLDPLFWHNQFLKAKEILFNNKNYIKSLKEKMQEASNNLHYELAKTYKDQISALQFTTKDNIFVEMDSENYNFDVIGTFLYSNNLIINIMHFFNGFFVLQEKYVVEKDFLLKEEILENFLNQFYTKRNKPKYLILETKLSDFFQFNNEIKIKVPQKGKFKKALDNAIDNAKENYQEVIIKWEEDIKSYVNVQTFLLKDLELSSCDVILMIDNSHLNNYLPTSCLITYKNLKPYYENYRKFNIENNLEKKGDLIYLEEGLKKYFNLNNPLIPDILFVDGGKSQIKIAKKVLYEFGLKIPIIGLVKNDNHKTSYLLDENFKKIIIPKQIYWFFDKIQSEVDQYAKRSFAKKQIKNSLEHSLLKIDGIGIKTEEKILNHFKTYNNIYNASIDELAKIVSKKLAIKIKEYYKK